MKLIVIDEYIVFILSHRSSNLINPYHFEEERTDVSLLSLSSSKRLILCEQKKNATNILFVRLTLRLH